jgi:hypothetical protein
MRWTLRGGDSSGLRKRKRTYKQHLINGKTFNISAGIIIKHINRSMKEKRK